MNVNVIHAPQFNHGEYLDIIVAADATMMKFKEEFESLDKKAITTQELVRVYSGLTSNISIVILFSALYAEGEINVMGEAIFGRSEFQDHYDSLRAVDKLMIIHKAHFGVAFDKSINEYRLLCELMKTRNDMAHPKSKIRNYSYIDEIAKAKDAISVNDWLMKYSEPILEKYCADEG